MASAWKAPEAIPDFVECPSHILVWNECNGVSQITVEPNDIWEFRGGRSGWRLWRPVPEPTESDIQRAKTRTLNEVLRNRASTFTAWREKHDANGELTIEEAAWRYAGGWE